MTIRITDVKEDQCLQARGIKVGDVLPVISRGYGNQDRRVWIVEKSGTLPIALYQDEFEIVSVA